MKRRHLNSGAGCRLPMLRSFIAPTLTTTDLPTPLMVIEILAPNGVDPHDIPLLFHSTDSGKAAALPRFHASSDGNDLSAGAYTFHVRATDLAGNTGEAASYAWTVTRRRRPLSKQRQRPAP
jgi:hypothetical protein